MARKGSRLEVLKVGSDPAQEGGYTKRGQWYWRKRASNGQIVSGAWDTFQNRGHAIRQARKEYPTLSLVVLGAGNEPTLVTYPPLQES